MLYLQFFSIRIQNNILFLYSNYLGDFKSGPCKFKNFMAKT